jgi:hypothetical protein
VLRLRGDVRAGAARSSSQGGSLHACVCLYDSGGVACRGCALSPELEGRARAPAQLGGRQVWGQRPKLAAVVGEKADRARAAGAVLADFRSESEGGAGVWQGLSHGEACSFTARGWACSFPVLPAASTGRLVVSPCYSQPVVHSGGRSLAGLDRCNKPKQGNQQPTSPLWVQPVLKQVVRARALQHGLRQAGRSVGWRRARARAAVGRSRKELSALSVLFDGTDLEDW